MRIYDISRFSVALTEGLGLKHIFTKCKDGHPNLSSVHVFAYAHDAPPITLRMGKD